MKPLTVPFLALALAAGACAPHSIAEAIAQRRDEFPRNSYVLVPPADVPRLGETIEKLDDRRARPTGTKCFDVAPVTGNGLEKIELEYKADSAFQSEVKDLAAQAHGSLQASDKATIALEGLKVVEGIGVPILGSACNFHDGAQTVEVITATVVAGTAKIEFSRNIAFAAGGTAGWTSGTANAGASVGTSQSGRLQGTNIVIAGSVTPVQVTLTSKQQDLGPTPAPGTVVAFPSGFDGNVRVDGLNTATADSIPLLAVTANTTMNASAQNVPANLTACKVGESTSLKPGTKCFVWNQSGASGVNVWFEKTPVGGADHIVLHADGYRTTFAPARR